MKNSMQSLIKMFPHFFDKSETSNFFKSQSVTNNLLKGIFQSISDVSDSLRLRKRCCIWKEQSVPYDYVINFDTHKQIILYSISISSILFSS